MAPRIERAPRWRGAQPPPSATPLTSTLCSSIASGSRRGPRRPSESVVCAVRRRPEVARSSAPTSAGSRNSATSVPHPVRFPAGYPPFRHFLSARQPWGGEGGLAVAAAPSSRLGHRPVSAWEASAHVTAARACGTAAGPGRGKTGVAEDSQTPTVTRAARGAAAGPARRARAVGGAGRGGSGEAGPVSRGARSTRDLGGPCAGEACLAMAGEACLATAGRPGALRFLPPGRQWPPRVLVVLRWEPRPQALGTRFICALRLPRCGSQWSVAHLRPWSRALTVRVFVLRGKANFKCFFFFFSWTSFPLFESSDCDGQAIFVWAYFYFETRSLELVLDRIYRIAGELPGLLLILVRRLDPRPTHYSFLAA